MPFLKALTHALKAILAAVAAGPVRPGADGKPIRMVHTAAAAACRTPSPASSPKALPAAMQQAVIVDAKPGASGIIASQDVARSAPDEYAAGHHELACPGRSC